LPCCWNGEEILDRLAELIIAIADLAEAEGRALRHALTRTGWGLVCLLVTGILVAVGAGFGLWAGYQFLLTRFSEIEAALLSGLFAFVLAGGFAWMAIRFNR